MNTRARKKETSQSEAIREALSREEDPSQINATEWADFYGVSTTRIYQLRREVLANGNTGQKESASDLSSLANEIKIIKRIGVGRVKEILKIIESLT